MFHERRVTANERKRVERGLSRNGVVLYHGAASFLDPHTIRVVTEVQPHDGGHGHGGPHHHDHHHPPAPANCTCGPRRS